MRYLWKLLVRVGETRNLSRNWLETPPGCIIEFKKVGSRVARPTLVTFLIARKTLPYDVSLAKQQLLQIFLTLPSILNPSSFPFLHRAKFQRTIVSSIVDEFGGKENVNSKLGILDDSPFALVPSGDISNEIFLHDDAGRDRTRVDLPGLGFLSS